MSKKKSKPEKAKMAPKRESASVKNKVVAKQTIPNHSVWIAPAEKDNDAATLEKSL